MINKPRVVELLRLAKARFQQPDVWGRVCLCTALTPLTRRHTVQIPEDDPDITRDETARHEAMRVLLRTIIGVSELDRHEYPTAEVHRRICAWSDVPGRKLEEVLAALATAVATAEAAIARIPVLIERVNERWLRIDYQMPCFDDFLRCGGETVHKAELDMFTTLDRRLGVHNYILWICKTRDEFDSRSASYVDPSAPGVLPSDLAPVLKQIIAPPVEEEARRE